MSMYYKGKLISGIREIPHLTLAQYNALTNKPDVWVRTDAPDSDRGISASDVEYSTGVSVEDKIDSMDKETSFSPTTNANGVVSSSYYNILQNKAILSAICTTEEDSIVVLGHNTAGNWLKVMNYDLTPIANKQVTIKMWYKDLSYNP